MAQEVESDETVTRFIVHDRDGKRVPIEVARAPDAKARPIRAARRSKRQVQTGVEPFTQRLTADYVKRVRGDANVLEIVRALRDLDPQVSQAVWNYLRLMNPGHDVKAYTFAADGVEQELPGAAQTYLEDLVRRVGAEYGGGLDQLLNVLSLQIITHGAVALEVTPTVGLDDVFDWYPVDPSLLEFARDDEGHLLLGQKFGNGDFVELNPDLVLYQPLDPDTDDPYGRMPLVSAINAVVSKAAVLADLRAVSHNQGYPRIDVSVAWDAILAAAPPQLRQDGQQAALTAWANEELKEIVTQYQNLEVDDTFVHYDFVQLKMVGGTAPASLGFDFKQLFGILERQLNMALKSLPILAGLDEAGAADHGSIQWQIQIAGIETLQRLLKRVVEKAFATSLRLRGFAAHGKVSFRTIRNVDRLYEAQSSLFEAKAHQIAQQMGWEDGDQAAMAVLGHVAASDPLPQPGANADMNPNNSGDKTPGAAENGPGAGGDEVQPPNEVEAKGRAAWDLLMFELGRDAAPVGSRRRNVDNSNEIVDKYAKQASLIFLSSLDVLLETMEREGMELRDAEKDIADYVFGLRYSREMKRLLRAAIVEGMRAAGLTDDDLEADERIVRRIWNENLQYVRKLRDDLKAALRSGEFQSLDDVRAWFAANAWREQMMGRYLGKQGYEAGFAAGRTAQNAGARFTWNLGANDNHCGSCVARDGKQYSHEELLSVGFPGSGALLCGANCYCTLEEVA